MADFSLAQECASGIYQIRNLVSGKRYVGSAVNLAHRWRQHQCELRKGRHNPHLQNAWGKHGASSFVFEVIEYVPSAENLIAREQFFIDTLRPEYNHAMVAGSNYGIRWSEDVKARMSVANKDVWNRPGHREKMSNAHKGYVPTAQQIQRMSDARKGKRLSPSHKAIVAKNNAARNRSEAHRELMSKFWSGRKKTPEQIEKMAATKRGKPAPNRGVPASEQQKAKQSESMRLKYANDPALRRRISEATKAAMRRPDVIEKIRKARKWATKP